MKARTEEFKNRIAKIYEAKDIVTYTSNNEFVKLTDEELISINPITKTTLLKSVMKCLKIKSKLLIPKKTIINYQFGVKTREAINNDDGYDYVNYGNYVVKDIEKLEDEESYMITCYDKMLYSMIPYESLSVEYPVTIRDYIDAMCDRLNLTFANASDEFVNYDKEIQKELYLDSDGKDLGYTFRDVLNELAEVTASNIVINENDELEIRYITETNDIINEEYFDETNVTFGEVYGPINTIVLSRSAGTDKISQSYPTDLADEDKKAIEISGNQILNGNNRSDFISGILNQLNGLSYCTNSYSSKGIMYYDVCDKYTTSIFGQEYNCVMFNDDALIDASGIVENVNTEIPEQAVQDYKKMDTTDRRINQTTLIVDKQTGQIEALTSVTQTLQDAMGNVYTIDQVNTLIQNAETGLTNTFSTSGGNNIFRNTGLWFKTSTGENLFNKDRANIIVGYFDSNHTAITSSSNNRTLYIECKPNTTYIVTKAVCTVYRTIGCTATEPAIGVETFSRVNIPANGTTATITTPSNAKYLVLRYYNSNQDTITEEEMRASVTIKEDTSNNPYEYWNGKVEEQNDDKASNGRAMLLQSGTLEQNQTVPNGTYTVSFKYKKLIALANTSCEINDVAYQLTGTTDTEFVQTIEVSSQNIKLEFITDVNDSCEIYDLMANAGETKFAYSQNQNETTTNTVNISKGISISNSDTTTTFRADADGIRTLDQNGNVLTKFTDKGMTNKEMIIENQAEIVGVLVQQVENQTWFTRM